MSTKLTDSERKQKNSQKINDSGFSVPQGRYTIEKIDYDEENSYKPLSLFLKDSHGVIFTTSVRSFWRPKFDYNNNPIELKGSLIKHFIDNYSGLTQGEVIEKVNSELVNKEIDAILINYRGITKSGDVRMLTTNDFELIFDYSPNF